MKGRKLFITEFDKNRLEELISADDALRQNARDDLADLRQELSRAKVVGSKKVPPEVVTMNSRVVLVDADTGERMTYTLVFPKDADIDSGCISVLAPVGTAILGYAEGDVVEWDVPSGTRRIKIEKVVYQPESAGDLHL